MFFEVVVVAYLRKSKSDMVDADLLKFCLAGVLIARKSSLGTEGFLRPVEGLA